jgi:7-carboxy-7-deazaguanine synthase
VSVDEVVAEAGAFGPRLAELTGGEPLLQPAAIPLMERLVGEGWEVLLETGGHLPIDDVPDEVVVILDVKCPGSGESDRVHWPNLDQVSKRDEVKFVLAGRADFDFACQVVTRYDLTTRAGAVLFSPVHGALAPADLARWILEARLPVRLQLQQHKYIWSPEARGV